MGFDGLADQLNSAVLDTFGEEPDFTLQRVQSGSGSLAFRGVLGPGPEPENQPPGGGSMLAVVFTEAGAISPDPEKGDQVSTPSTVYYIVDIHKDAGRGLYMVLRKDRMAI
jgi:hypothetical protein